MSVSALDLSDQDSVRKFTAAWDRPLHILVNNAGIMALPQLKRNGEGWEMQFATNFMGHFFLTVGLHEALAAAHGARIVSVSSSGNLRSPVVFDGLHFDFRPTTRSPPTASPRPPTRCSPWRPRGGWSGEGVYANALNPGAIATGLQKHTGGLKTPKELRKTVPQGAATSVLLAASPLLDKVGGRYFEDCNEATTVTRRPRRLRRRRLVRPRPRERGTAVGHRTRPAIGVSHPSASRAAKQADRPAARRQVSGSYRGRGAACPPAPVWCRSGATQLTAVPLGPARPRRLTRIRARG